MFYGLIPDDDRKQQLRTIRLLQANGGGLILTIVALLAFFAGGFRLSATGFSFLLGGFWAGNIIFYLIVRTGLNRRFNDPSMTQTQMIWAILVVLSTLFFMAQFRFLMIPFLPLALIFGAFQMTSRQYLVMALLTVAGYCSVMGLLYIHQPETIRPDEEILGGIVFMLIIVAFSIVGSEISQLRRKLHRRNADLAEAMQKMEHMANTDELTGLINRRQMMFVLGQHKAIVDRGGGQFCICFFDIDRFKNVNDTMGHHIGDVVLKRFAEASHKTLRASDLLARFGGEEFVLLTTGVDLSGAAMAADRIRHTIHAIDFNDIAPSLTVTLSAGVAQFRPKEEIRSILSRADRALYLAKNSGRNCIKLETEL